MAIHHDGSRGVSYEPRASPQDHTKGDQTQVAAPLTAPRTAARIKILAHTVKRGFEHPIFKVLLRIGDANLGIQQVMARDGHIQPDQNEPLVTLGYLSAKRS